MKFYLHKELNKMLLVFTIVFVCCLWMVKSSGIDFSGIVLLSIFGLTVVISLWAIWKYRNEEVFEPNPYKRMQVVIGDNELSFPKGYCFKNATVKQGSVIPASSISEITTNTFPVSMVIYDNEVIFAKEEQKDELLEFARRNSIPIVERVDIWSLINDPFLDTEFTNEQMQQTINILVQQGLAEEEIQAIRKRVGIWMLGASWATWEWLYYGHFHHLYYACIGSNNYWRSMDIALRNFESKQMPN